MRIRFFILTGIVCFLSLTSNAQFVYKIKADSLKITNDSCTAELILENSTKNVQGFLYNKGNGRTEFRKGLIRINDSLYIIGGDTLNIAKGVSESFIRNQNAVAQAANFRISGTGTVGETTINGTFAVSTGTIPHKPLDISPVYNQTGTATGSIYGLYYNPTITSVLGTHYFLHAETGSNVLNGRSGSTTFGDGFNNLTSKLTINPYSADGDYLMSITGSNIKRGALKIDATNFTPYTPSIITIEGTCPYIGGSGKPLYNIDVTQTDVYTVIGYKSKIYRTAANVASYLTKGFEADVDGYGGNTYGFYSKAVTSAASPAGTAYAFYAAAGKSYFADNVGIGTTTPNNKIQVADLINFNNTDFNTTLGYQAGKNIVTGAQYNTFVGYQSGLSATTGGTTAAFFNTAVGANTFKANTTGTRNVAIGYGSLVANTSGYDNTAIGVLSLFTNTTGRDNIAIGDNAMRLNTTGFFNVAIGNESLESNTTGSYLTAVGYQVLANNTTGSFNVGVGEQALILNTTGSFNTAVGLDALFNTTTGGYNVAMGYGSSYFNTTGIRNTAIGYEAGKYAGTGTTNGVDNNATATYAVYLGYRAHPGGFGNTNEIVIGADAIGNGSNTVMLGNSSIIATYLKGNVLIGTNTDVASSKLTVESTTQGFLKPRMTTTQRNAISSPVAGLSVYNTTLNTNDTYNGSEYFSFGNQIILPATNTATGTTGNQTINKASGTVNIAAAGTTVTVTNSLVSANSIVVATLRTNDATAYIKNVVPGAGTFTINLGAAATGEVNIGFVVFN